MTFSREGWIVLKAMAVLEVARISEVRQYIQERHSAIDERLITTALKHLHHAKVLRFYADSQTFLLLAPQAQAYCLRQKESLERQLEPIVEITQLLSQKER